ncbi:GNAT family N-acetyltransferase [Robiginitalea sp. IMCC44478]|uniref:GNAT family N-acetyltransferase n=1 Tax=Robiginitalea sp. IMCC44478 TaxID=3459122 RepID=UPI00404381C5
MEIVYRPAETREELKSILELQKLNHFSVLSEEERAVEGFVTLRHTLPLLQKMKALCPQLMVLADQKLAGYALCLHPDLSALIPGLQPMFLQLKGLDEPINDFRVMGQICIASEFRRKGLFRGLYDHFKKMVSPSAIVTEVACSNVRSLKAHHAVGFRSVAFHKEADQSWEVLCWK